MGSVSKWIIDVLLLGMFYLSKANRNAGCLCERLQKHVEVLR